MAFYIAFYIQRRYGTPKAERHLTILFSEASYIFILYTSMTD